jgi:transcriptional regulator with XRE-family HTH domain
MDYDVDKSGAKWCNTVLLHVREARIVICHRCNSVMQRSLERYAYRESGLENVFIDRCIIHTCGKCNIRMAVLPDSETAAREIVRILVLQKRRLDGQAILFLRKVMRLKAIELAEILRVGRVSVSRWENNQVGIEAINYFRLRMAAVDRVIARPAQKEEADVLKMLICLLMQGDYEPSRDVGNVEFTISSPLYESDSLIDSSATVGT